MDQNKIKDMMQFVEYEDLIKIKQDLKKGGYHLRELVDEKIDEKEQEHNKICAVCQNTLEKNSTNNFTLVFGPDWLRKKASFCGSDCLQYFISSLDDMKKRNNI